MKKLLPFLILALILSMIPQGGSSANTSAIQLGSDVLFDQFHHLIEGKKSGARYKPDWCQQPRHKHD